MGKKPKDARADEPAISVRSPRADARGVTIPAPAPPSPSTTPSRLLSSRSIRVDPLVGSVVGGHFVIEVLLGEGAMGRVYRARHRMIDKLVAVKVLKSDAAHDREQVDRLLHEARTASKIGNAHVVEVSDFGVLPDGATYCVMEYLDGTTLAKIIEQGPLPLPRILHIAKQVARGLAAAHDADIVHRDLKPDNVMLLERASDPDFVKVLDFGIAKVGALAPKASLNRFMLGTPHYMSPEQASNDPVDRRADVYALGIMLYEMATGRVPFDADSVMGVLAMHANATPKPVIAASGRTDLPAAFEALVTRCLEKRVDDRYSSMAAIADELQSIDDDVVFSAAAPAETTIAPVFVDFPAVHESSGVMFAPASARTVPTLPPSSRGLVLVLDDSETCREIARLTLTAEGYDVIAVGSGAALDDALGATQPVIALIDVSLPGTDGASLVRSLQKRGLDKCPFVLYSDLPEEELRRLVRECNAAGYLRKTANSRRLDAALSTFIPR